MCEHKWIFQGSDYKYSYGSNQDLYERVDTYFCEKCLEVKEVLAKREYSRGKPYWFNK